jgi:hypothetical protein
VVGDWRLVGMENVSRPIRLQEVAHNVSSFELGLGWFGNYDSYDLAALSLLSHGPPVCIFQIFV